MYFYSPHNSKDLEIWDFSFFCMSLFNSLPKTWCFFPLVFLESVISLSQTVINILVIVPTWPWIYSPGSRFSAPKQTWIIFLDLLILPRKVSEVLLTLGKNLFSICSSDWIISVDLYSRWARLSLSFPFCRYTCPLRFISYTVLFRPRISIWFLFASCFPVEVFYHVYYDQVFL